MNLTARLRAAWHAMTGKRADPYAGTYGSGGAAGFAGGSVGRLTASLASWSNSINADNDVALPILRARARALAANNEHGKRFLSLVATNVVGRRNPKLQVRAMMANPDRKGQPVLDKVANDTIEIHWDRWGKTADITGRHRSIYTLMRTIIKSVARDGEALVRIVRDRRLPYGLGLQLLEADRLDDARNVRLDNGNTVRQGVEIDGTGRAVAYWVRTAHPGENYATRSADIERVPAAQMMHVFLNERAEQVRGVTWFHAVIIRASVIHNFEEAAVVAAQIGASKIAALERSEEAPDAISSMADGKTSSGLSINVEAGEMFELPAGYKLNSWNPEYPHANFESFLKACLRGLAAGWDVASHNLTGDMTEVNYSSARIAELNERETWMGLQDWFIESFAMPLYEEWLALALLNGAIIFENSGKPLPADKLQKFLSASRFQGRRWSWVDPSKEADANEKQLANKLTSRTRLAAEQGEEFDDILDELAQEEAQIEAVGLAAPAPVAPPKPTEPPPDTNLGKALALLLARAAEPREPAAPSSVVVNQAPITVNTPEIRVDNHQPAPVTHVAITQEAQAAPTVEVRAELVLPEQPAPVVEVTVEMPAETTTHIASMPTRRTKSEVDRNMAGEIVRAEQVESDA